MPEHCDADLVRRQAELHAVMEFLADFHGEVNDSQVLSPEDYRASALSLLDAIEAARLSGRDVKL